MATIDKCGEGMKKDLKRALDRFGKTEQQLGGDVKIIKDWLITQPHLPEISSNNHIINTLILNKFSVEICKQRLDMFYTIRTLLPEIYERMDFELMIEIAYSLYFFPLRKKTPDGERIRYVKIVDKNPDKMDPYYWIGYCLNSYELSLQGDICIPEIFICDMQGLKFAHIRKFTPIHMKKFVMNIEKVYNNAMKQFHFMNCPRFAYSLMNLMKSLMKPKLASRVFLYEDASIIREIIPLEALPSDYGGPELSLYKLNELWKKKLAKYENRFDALAKMKTNEKLRPQPLTNDEVLGFHGNFKTLDVD